MARSPQVVQWIHYPHYMVTMSQSSRNVLFFWRSLLKRGKLMCNWEINHARKARVVVCNWLGVDLRERNKECAYQPWGRCEMWVEEGTGQLESRESDIELSTWRIRGFPPLIEKRQPNWFDVIWIVGGKKPAFFSAANAATIHKCCKQSRTNFLFFYCIFFVWAFTRNEWGSIWLRFEPRFLIWYGVPCKRSPFYSNSNGNPRQEFEAALSQIHERRTNQKSPTIWAQIQIKNHNPSSKPPSTQVFFFKNN